MSKELTPKQDLFCKEYMQDFNATQAYLRAGYKSKNNRSASVMATRMLMKPNISDKIIKLKEKRDKKLEINSEWVLKEAVEVYKIAKGEKPHIVSKDNNGIIEKTKVYKTSLREANRALEIIGKHIDVKAFERDIVLDNSTSFTVIVPKELESNEQQITN